MAKFKMKGVVPPMIIPFKENGDVDFEGLKTLTAFLRDNVDGLFINGSYGSGVLMTNEERKQTAQVVMDTVGGKIPVVVHVGCADTKSSRELACHAKEIGAAAVSAVGPFYYKHNPDSICEYYEGILEGAGEVPVYVYNNPQFQGYPMSIDLLAKLKSLGLSGIKDATFDIMLHANYMRKLKDDNFDIALGTEAMWLAACVLGCEAYIPGLGNAFPEICGQMYREGMAGDIEACRATQFKVNELRDIMYLAKSTQLAVYVMLELRGVIKAYPRSPFFAASEQEKEAVRKKLVAIGML